MKLELNCPPPRISTEALPVGLPRPGQILSTEVNVVFLVVAEDVKFNPAPGATPTTTGVRSRDFVLSMAVASPRRKQPIFGLWSQGGPDVVQNGIALSGTIHWLFDRHLISLTDDYRVLVSHNKVPAELRSLISSQMNRIHLPVDKRLWPHAAYLARHRERFVTG